MNIRRVVIGSILFVIMLPVILTGFIYFILKTYFKCGHDLADLMNDSLDLYLDKYDE